MGATLLPDKWTVERMLDKLPELMADPEFAKTYRESSSEFALAREIIMARVGAGLSQQDLARKMETTQSVVARLESGRHLPSMSTLKKLADATGTHLSIHLERVTRQQDATSVQTVAKKKIKSSVKKNRT